MNRITLLGHHGKTLSFAVAAVAFLLATSSVNAHQTEPIEKAGQNDEATTVSQAESSRIELIVRELIRKHPELIAEALEQHYANQAAKDEQARADKLMALRDDIESTAGGFALGPPEGEAAVIITDFFDYHCGFCKRATNDIFVLSETYRDIRIVFKELPVIRDESRLAAKAALAARQQGKYVSFHRALMRTAGVLTEERLDVIALELGLDLARLKIAMDDPAIERELQANLALADDIGLIGTPAFFVDGELVTGRNNARLKELVAQARASTSQLN